MAPDHTASRLPSSPCISLMASVVSAMTRIRPISSRGLGPSSSRAKMAKPCNSSCSFRCFKDRTVQAASSAQRRRRACSGPERRTAISLARGARRAAAFSFPESRLDHLADYSVRLDNDQVVFCRLRESGRAEAPVVLRSSSKPAEETRRPQVGRRRWTPCPTWRRAGTATRSRPCISPRSETNAEMTELRRWPAFSDHRTSSGTAPLPTNGQLARVPGQW